MEDVVSIEIYNSSNIKFGNLIQKLRLKWKNRNQVFNILIQGDGQFEIILHK